jgi:hypothetical protein
VTYQITFACYGCRLHGNAAGSVDRWHNVPGTPVVEEHLARSSFEEERMDQPPYLLGPWLWKPQHVSAAIQYVVAEQRDVMSVFEAQEV